MYINFLGVEHAESKSEVNFQLSAHSPHQAAIFYSQHITDLYTLIPSQIVPPEPETGSNQLLSAIRIWLSPRKPILWVNKKQCRYVVFVSNLTISCQRYYLISMNLCWSFVRMESSPYSINCIYTLLFIAITVQESRLTHMVQRITYRVPSKY